MERLFIPSSASGLGLLFVFLFTPTFTPRKLWWRQPELHPDIEYVTRGFPYVCPSQKPARPDYSRSHTKREA
jgi:hypothetical protein